VAAAPRVDTRYQGTGLNRIATRIPFARAGKRPQFDAL
jgi:hypothetical protein